MKISRNLATLSTIISFFIVAVSGIILFLNLEFGGVEMLHEYVGIIMVVASILHIIVNFNAFKKYFTKQKILATMLPALILSGLIVFGVRQDDPKDELFEVFSNARLSQIIHFFANR